MKTIESAANPAVRRLVDLRKRRNRTAQGRFLIEGAAEVERALDSGIQIEALFVTEPTDPILERAAASVTRLAGAAARRAFVRERGGSVLAIAQSPEFGLDTIPSGDFAVLAESIEKPGNLGAMLRSSDAAGVGVVLVCDPAVEPLNPNVIRASLGTIFTVPLAACSLPDAVDWCRAQSMQIVALDPTGVPLYDIDLTSPSALAVGAEHAGISPELRDAADLCASIPMAGSADSLNAATALAIGLFEVVRQRSGLGPEA